jgi:hypothetical protein
MIRTKSEMTSITKSGTAAGPVMPGGTKLLPKPTKPFTRTPSMWYAIQTTRVSASGTDRLAVGA